MRLLLRWRKTSWPKIYFKIKKKLYSLNIRKGITTKEGGVGVAIWWPILQPIQETLPVAQGTQGIVFQ